MRVAPVSLRLALIGWGAIGHTVSDMLAGDPDGALVDIVAVGGRPGAGPPDDLPAEAVFVNEPDRLADLHLDLVVEAAGRDAVATWGRAALDAGVDLVVSSVSAFADDALFDSLRSRAATTGAQIHIQPGALGGVDALAAARLLGVDEVEHRIVKPPRAWLGTPAEQLCDLGALTGVHVFFTGTAAEAADRFPKNANVAMTSALAGVGPARTWISLVADPHADVNRHEVAASGAFGELSVVVANNPLPANPKTSAMAALNLVRTIRNRTAAVVI